MSGEGRNARTRFGWAFLLLEFFAGKFDATFLSPTLSRLMPAGFCFEQSTKGASLAIVVGSLTADTVPTLRPYRAILWFVAPAQRTTWPADLPAPCGVVDIPANSPGAIEAALDSFVLRDTRCLPTVLLSEAVLGDEASANALGEIIPALRRIHTIRQTRQIDGGLWQRHVLSNLAAYVRRRLPPEWAGTLAGLPAVICGAGPSLDTTGPLLKDVVQRAVVFSADSALGALARQQVVADFGISLDAAKVPEKCLAGVSHPPRWLGLANLSPPEWLQVPVEAGSFFCSSSQITVDWLEAQGVARTLVPGQDNCGVTALALARFLGCSPIYLFGMDQALDENEQQRRHHQGANAELYAESGFKAESRHPRVPGNYAMTVPTHIEGDWQALNATLATWPRGLVFNVTDRGARLNNTTLMAPGDWAVPTGGETKARRVEGMTLTAAPEALVDAVLARVRAGAQARLPQIEALASNVTHSGPALTQHALRLLFANADFAQIMGAFSLKLMPHLPPPLEKDITFWQDLVAECLDLTQLAAKIR